MDDSVVLGEIRDSLKDIADELSNMNTALFGPLTGSTNQIIDELKSIKQELEAIRANAE